MERNAGVSIRHPRTRRVGRGLVGAIAAATLLVGLAACSSDDGAGTDDEAPGASASSTTRAPAQIAPTEVASEEELFEAPAPIPDVAHGTLLRYQVMAESVSDKATTYRMMYASRSLGGEPIVVTGIAVVPDGPAPPDGRPVLSIGHGTTGIADSCAPSRQPPREAALGTFAAERNWIMAISDYEGLGTPGRHPYLVGESAGRGVLDAATAVSQLPGAAASEQLLLAGYSQGGQAVLFAGEIAPEWTPDLEVVGTVAGAPVSGLAELFDSFVDGPQAGFAYMMLAGFHAAYPDEADLALVLTPEGVSWLDVVDDGCKAEVFSAVADRSASELLLQTRINVDPWRDLLEQSEPGRVAQDAPILVLHNPADEVIAVAFSEELVERLCASGQDVELRLLPDATHLAAGAPAFLHGFDWLAARLAGQPTSPTCDAAATSNG